MLQLAPKITFMSLIGASATFQNFFLFLWMLCLRLLLWHCTKITWYETFSHALLSYQFYRFLYLSCQGKKICLKILQAKTNIQLAYNSPSVCWLQHRYLYVHDNRNFRFSEKLNYNIILMFLTALLLRNIVLLFSRDVYLIVTWIGLENKWIC